MQMNASLCVRFNGILQLFLHKLQALSWKKKIVTISSAMLEGKIETYVKTMIYNGLAKLCFVILNTQLKTCLRERLRFMLKQ